MRASPRERWFLAEYARRNRSTEIEMLLETLDRIARAAARPNAPGKVFAELVDMSEAIARTRREMAQIRPSRQFDKQILSATEELDHIVEA